MVKSGEFVFNLLFMLIGEFRTKLGDKNRTPVPKKFREEIGENCIVTQGYERCLVMVSSAQWSLLTQQLDMLPFTNNTLRDTARFLIGGAVELDLDKQGRFVIPENLREYASLNDEVVFLGLQRWVEIWDKKKWEERKLYLYENSTQIADQLNSIR